VVARNNAQDAPPVARTDGALLARSFRHRRSARWARPTATKYLYWQNLLFRQYATGNFRALLKAVNRDPAMLWWLDNYLSVKDSPNENYARELMEIFSLGWRLTTRASTPSRTCSKRRAPSPVGD
jgi:hypothetical protein